MPPDDPAWPLRVLIVDDAASTRHFLRAVLEECPRFDVTGEAEDGTTAVAQAQVLQPDVVLLDLSMPLTGGSSALDRLREVAPDARVIIVSGMDAAIAAPLLQAGATAFIAKGLSPTELLARLGSILDRPIDQGRPAAQVEATVADARAPQTSALPRTQPRAVVCEDDATTRRLIGQVLANCGVAVAAEVDTVPSLLSVIDLGPPELVLLDLWLEGTPGSSALPEIHRRSPASIIIVYSAHEAWAGSALAAGASAFVAKPHFEKLAEQVRQLVARPSP